VFGEKWPTSNIARISSDLDGIACALATSAALCLRLASKLAVRLKNWVNGNNPRCEGIMRNLLGFILIIGVVGLLVYSLHSTGLATGTQADARKNRDTLTKADKLAPPRLGTPVPQPGAQKKTDTDTEFDAEQAALVKVMKAAIAARHGGVLPKTVSDEDARVASQAAAKWQAKQSER
jgi:hypothetical protein